METGVVYSSDLYLVLVALDFNDGSFPVNEEFNVENF